MNKALQRELLKRIEHLESLVDAKKNPKILIYQPGKIPEDTKGAVILLPDNGRELN